MYQKIWQVTRKKRGVVVRRPGLRPAAQVPSQELPGRRGADQHRPPVGADDAAGPVQEEKTLDLK